MIVWACAVIAVAAMLTDWWAVHTEQRGLESVAKPAVMIALLGFAATADMEPSSLRWWIIGALACGLVGDVLLLPQIDHFIGGLAAFLVGHSLYVIAFIGVIEPGPWIIAGVAGLIALVAVFARPIVGALSDSPLKLPVVAYIGISGAVLIGGAATGRWPIVLGALAFAASDGLLGSNRFVQPAPQLRPLVHALYHSGQAGIVAGTLVSI